MTYRVQAMDASGNVSGLSAPLTVTTLPDRTAPTTPGNLRVTGTGISTVSLAWDRSSDRWPFGYEVLMDGQVVSSVWHPYIGTPSTLLRKIPPGTHRFQVRARDSAGNLSGPSNAVTLTPPSATSTGIYTQPGTQTWTVKAVDRAGNTSAPGNAVTLTVEADQNLC